jgi:hypothetical protein
MIKFKELTEGLKDVYKELLEACHKWNLIDSFEPDWDDLNQAKYCIVIKRHRLIIIVQR